MKNFITFLFSAVVCVVLMSGIVDLNNLFNFEDQAIPQYISKDNTPQDNILSDPGATLGRVLFYDKNLSVDNTISCASCHLQKFAFGDTSIVSSGVNGMTGRHSMRLVNVRFSNEEKAFWDERASSVEDQTTQPIQDHVEMGYSGENGDPDFDVLIDKLENIDYYAVLFEFVYGDSEITELRVQKAIAQFVRSIQSFDSKFDEGRAQVANNETDFPNFSVQENLGKNLFFTHPPLGGAGCARCHSGTEFTLIPNSKNNGVIGVANNPDSIDLIVTKAPSLRDLVNPDGKMNGPFMHDGSLNTLMDVMNHYNLLEEDPLNTNLDFRLSGTMHHLDLSEDEKLALIAFLKTLTGVEIYSAVKWSNPFDDQENITVIPLDPSGITGLAGRSSFEIFPNPTASELTIQLDKGSYQLTIFDASGILVKSSLIQGSHVENLTTFPNGNYIVKIFDLNTKKIYAKTVVKR